MNLNLVFSRKYRWPEHYFSVWCMVLRKFSEITYYKPIFSQYSIFYKYISFFNLRFDLFSQSKQEKYSLCCSLTCFRVLLCTHYGPLQCFSTYFRKLKEIGVLQPIFPDYVISCDYAQTPHSLNSQNTKLKKIILVKNIILS